MSDPLVLGVDCGTQSLRAALYRLDGVLLAQAAHAYPTDCPHVNWAEQNPHDWWDSLCHAVRECLERARVRPEAVAAIACDGTSYTGVYCAEDGAPLRPAILWMDLRATEEAQRVEATHDPALETCGYRVSPEWMLPKTLWVARREPEIYAATKRVVEGVDWLIHRLCGRWVTSNSNASGKRHWTPDRSWPASFYASLGLDDLPSRSPDAVLYLGEPAGRLLPEAADALGLSPACVVSHSGMDGWTAPIGKNCFAPGCVSLTLGTSNVLVVESATPAIIDGAMGPFPDGIRRGYAAYEAGQTSGGSIVGWLLSILGCANDPHAHERLAREAAAIAPGSDGLVVFDAWRGNRNPYYDPAARGTICGLTLEHGPAHLYRAVLEGCAYGIRNVVETFEKGGYPIDAIRACGSGAANALWIRIIASATGKPISVSAEKHATCRGSAVCAAVACGAYSTIEEAAAAMAPQFETVAPEAGREPYDVFFNLYLDTYRNMKGVMKQLSETISLHR